MAADINSKPTYLAAGEAFAGNPLLVLLSLPGTAVKGNVLEFGFSLSFIS